MGITDLHPEEALEREALGTISPEMRKTLNEHVVHCPACAAERNLRRDFSSFDTLVLPGDEAAINSAIDAAMNAQPVATVPARKGNAISTLTLIVSGVALLLAGAALWSSRRQSAAVRVSDLDSPVSVPAERRNSRGARVPVPNLVEPVVSERPSDMALASAGRQHTCFTSKGQAFCWGRNHLGQLGDGTSVNRNAPVPAVGLSAVALVRSGDSFTCALETGGRVMCWGSNRDGQVGKGEQEKHSSAPTEVAGFKRADGLWVGANHACARESAGPKAGHIACWGANASGQLGDGTLVSRNTPVFVSELAGVREMALGINFSCALVEDSGVLCWGSNRVGQLGNGGFSESQARPAAVQALPPTVTIAAGHVHVCAIDQNKQQWCWGWNQYGQLGDGGTQNQPVPRMVLENAVAMALANRTTCSIQSGGHVSCWGLQSSIATGRDTASMRPQILPELAGATALTLGENHICTVAPGGGLLCLGANDFGQIGDGTRETRPQPTAIETPF